MTEQNRGRVILCRGFLFPMIDDGGDRGEHRVPRGSIFRSMAHFLFPAPELHGRYRILQGYFELVP